MFRAGCLANEAVQLWDVSHTHRRWSGKHLVSPLRSSHITLRQLLLSHLPSSSLFPPRRLEDENICLRCFYFFLRVHGVIKACGARRVRLCITTGVCQANEARMRGGICAVLAFIYTCYLVYLHHRWEERLSFFFFLNQMKTNQGGM